MILTASNFISLFSLLYYKLYIYLLHSKDDNNKTETETNKEIATQIITATLLRTALSKRGNETTSSSALLLMHRSEDQDDSTKTSEATVSERALKIKKLNLVNDALY